MTGWLRQRRPRPSAHVLAIFAAVSELAFPVACGRVPTKPDRVDAAPPSAASERPRLSTRWASLVDPDRVLPEYPRPQMTRPEWLSLNGVWEFEAGTVQPPPFGRALAKRIVVPFPIESSLSGVMQSGVVDALYRRTFVVPKAWSGRHVLLHFGAVDWESEVFVNGKTLGTHRGGYDSFSYDVTGALEATASQEVVVRVHDGTDQARGKQSRAPSGIYYTATTGIWQSVWLEPVPELSIASLRIASDVDHGTVIVTVTGSSGGSGQVTLRALDGLKVAATARGSLGAPLTLTLASPKLWSPDRPFLYGLKAALASGGKAIDSVESYFGMRKWEVKNISGVERVLLNGNPIFMLGPLDQGFWPDGIYTAPTDDALRFDLETEKKLGFNAVRKHVKVEPDRWYYYADTLGLAVWQDMPSGTNADPSARTQFEAELHRMIDLHFNHPSIAVWIPFNEGWGEYDGVRITKDILAQDPTRLVTPASGWDDVEAGQIEDMHCYSGPCAPASATRVRLNGEFGGWGLAIAGHMWGPRLAIYSGAADAVALNSQLAAGLRQLVVLRRSAGLSGAIYTQLTDVEGELNGLLTYDREVSKVDAAAYAPLAKALGAGSPGLDADWLGAP